jgi:hypothetical protein
MLIFLSCSLLAQENSNFSNDINSSVKDDSVNLQEYVRSQIAAAKEKEKVTSTNQSVSRKPEVIREEKVTGSGKNEGPLSPKILVLVTAGFFAFSFIGIRRLKLRSNNKLKKNINLIRKEYAVRKENPKLTGLRAKLCDGHDYYDADAKFFSERAKEYKISQGELILAARIKSHKMMKATEKV